MGRCNPSQISMKFLSLLMISAVFAASTVDRVDENLEELAEGMNPYGSLSEEEFLAQFHKPSFNREDESLEELAEGMNPYGSLDEDEFLEQFHQPPVDDPEEKEKRAEALKEHEQEILEN